MAAAATVDLDKTEHRSGKANATNGHLINGDVGRRRREQVAQKDDVDGGAGAAFNVDTTKGEVVRVPHIISYPSLATTSKSNSTEKNASSSNDRQMASYATSDTSCRRTSDLTTDVDDGDENENDALLMKRNESSYGGTSGGSGKTSNSDEVRKSILKPSLYSSLTASQRSPAGNNIVDNVPSSPKPSPRPRRASRRAPRDGDLRSSWLTNSITSHVSQMSVFSNSFRQRTINETTVLAPDDAELPPQTPLLGSSRFAANAFRDELRMREIELKKSDADSIASPGRNNRRGISWVNNDPDDGDAEDQCCNSTLGSHGGVSHGGSTARTLKEIEAEYLEKARTTFMNDAMTFAEGTIPQSIVLAFCIGVVCGVVAFMYYTVLDYFLELIWKDMPEWWVVGKWPEHLHVLWIPLVAFTLSVCCGLSIYYLGEPGDLAYTIKCVHEKGYKGTSHIVPMVASSLFSILAGASLGPEAPLVAICAATAGFLSRKVFKQKNRNVVRKHTFMGMSGALSAFFGVPLGGSLFALEVTSRFGVEYFEHLIEAIFAGEICVVVFRTLAGLPLGPIWKIAPKALEQTEPYMIVQGAIIGLLGAGLAFLWANFHWRLMDVFRSLGLLDDENARAVPRVLLGAAGVVAIGMMVPQTMFWGEWEIGTIATLSPAAKLPHVWPTAGLIGFEMDSCRNCLIVGFCKLVAISFTVAGGYRGGYIFPFFAAGAAFGRALCFVFPGLNPSIATLCFAASINVAITRTALATSLILASLSGEQFSLAAVLASSVVSLFATGYVPFIKSQLARSDIDFSLYYRKNRSPKIPDSFRIPKPLFLDVSDDE